MKVHHFENMFNPTSETTACQNNIMMMGASSTGGGMLNFDYGSMFDKNLDSQNYDFAIAGSGGSNQIGIFQAPSHMNDLLDDSMLSSNSDNPLTTSHYTNAANQFKS